MAHTLCTSEYKSIGNSFCCVKVFDVKLNVNTNLLSESGNLNPPNIHIKFLSESYTEQCLYILSGNVLFKRVLKYSNSLIKASDFSKIENKKLKREIHAGSIFKISHFFNK